MLTSPIPGLREERMVIDYTRKAIANYDADPAETRDYYYLARGVIIGYMGEWSDAFVDLIGGMDQIWCDFTPMKQGNWKTSHVASGYSSIETQRWVADKTQPPRQTVEEALARFDALVAPFVQSQEVPA